MWERPFAAMQQHADAAGKIDWTGLWERLRGGSQRVALLLTDSFTGLLWHPLVAKGKAVRALGHTSLSVLADLAWTGIASAA